MELNLTEQQIAQVVAHWPVGDVLETRAGAGSANPAAIVITERGQFFFKQRNPRYAGPDQLVYDHAVMRRLHAAGLPVIPALNTAEGRPWHVEEGGVYELYPYLMEGEEHTPGSEAQVAAAGAMLASLHLAGEGFEPPCETLYDRRFPPQEPLEALIWAHEQATAPGPAREGSDRQSRAILDYALAVCRGMAERLSDESYHALPGAIMHGDWHPANLKFAGSRVVGIFDFDWVGPNPRAVDIVDGLLFFCSRRRRPLVAADIRTLTQAFEPDWRLMEVFGRAYMRNAALTGAEIAALPDLMRVRWLYTRTDAMTRKIPPGEKLSYLTEEFDGPLRWVDENERRIASGDWLRDD